MTNFSTRNLQIPFFKEPLIVDLQGVRSMMELNSVKIAIDTVNWSAYPYKPIVHLYAVYSKSYLWLLYEVKGDFFRAKALIDQQTVWTDSCVEFFISTEATNGGKTQLNEQSLYRNFEFNPLGICLSAYGSKFSREHLISAEMKQILRFPGINTLNLPLEGTEFDWELGVAIPLVLLGLQPGSVFKANFYKCGDLTQKPHFLSWRSIESDAPDFHLPQFFGDLELVI